MSNLLWNALKLSPVLLGITLLLANRTMADSVVPAKKLATPNQTDSVIGQIEQYSLSPTIPNT
ncbi:MAG: hypothetical protein PUP92_13350, partial [Rhizonema sp. PD38]|nr:hypothetical protein [Rhizonema sp. PD38]